MGSIPSSPVSKPSRRKQLGERRPHRAHVSVLDLERDPEAVRSRGAEQSLGAALGRPALELTHQQRVGGLRAADQLRVSPHRGGHPRAALALLEPGEHRGHPLERQREREHAAAVDGGREVVAADARGLCDLGETRVLDRMRAEPVATARPAA